MILYEISGGNLYIRRSFYTTLKIFSIVLTILIFAWIGASILEFITGKKIFRFIISFIMILLSIILLWIFFTEIGEIFA